MKTKFYHVETQERNYNSIDSKKHFQQVRKNWGDTSPIVTVCIWNTEERQGWQKIDATGW